MRLCKVSLAKGCASQTSPTHMDGAGALEPRGCVTTRAKPSEATRDGKQGSKAPGVGSNSYLKKNKTKLLVFTFLTLNRSGKHL